MTQAERAPCLIWRRFLRAWAKDPLGIAAVAPSGAALRPVDHRRDNARNGAGDRAGARHGGIHQGIARARGLRQSDLILIEYEADFARLLATRFPRRRRCCAAMRRASGGNRGLLKRRSGRREPCRGCRFST